MLESTEKGSVRNSIRNCLTVFQNDPLLSGAIAKNLLTERVDIVKPIGYHRIGTAITDTDMNYRPSDGCSGSGQHHSGEAGGTEQPL